MLDIRYAITGTEEDWDEAERQVKASLGKTKPSAIVNVKNAASTKKRKLTETAAEIAANLGSESAGSRKNNTKKRKKI
jgi:hypothetical protein